MPGKVVGQTTADSNLGDCPSQLCGCPIQKMAVPGLSVAASFGTSLWMDPNKCQYPVRLWLLVWDKTLDSFKAMGTVTFVSVSCVAVPTLRKDRSIVYLSA